MKKMMKLDANNPQAAAFVIIFNPLCILNTQGMCALYSVTGNVGILVTTEILYVKKRISDRRLWAKFSIVDLIFDMIFIS